MKFDFARIHQIVTYQVSNRFYVGVGYNYDSYFKIVDEKLRLNPGDTLLTSHYTYNTLYGFSTEKYFSSALAELLSCLPASRLDLSYYQGCLEKWRGIFSFPGHLSSGMRKARKLIGERILAVTFDKNYEIFNSNITLSVT